VLSIHENIRRQCRLTGTIPDEPKNENPNGSQA
jgi:hypothetical protein